MPINQKPALSTKAKTLFQLAKHLKTAQILPIFWLTVSDFHNNSDIILEQINQKFDTQTLVVRSSAINEDASAASMAGHYTSVLHVLPAERTTAIQTVIASYRDHPNMQDEVLIQPMLQDVSMSGVAFTQDPSTGAPYKVINYDTNQDTASVTSGTKNTEIFVTSRLCQTVDHPFLQKILNTLNELESLYDFVPLDVEFAITANGVIYVLQVRPLIINKPCIDETQHNMMLRNIAEKIVTFQQPHPFLHGQTTVFGVMPDWNPAEIIGVRPRPLSLSLYRELVTDAIWAYQRHNYGYRNLRSFPLLVNFAGQPYIDVRLSFNSFIPKTIDDKLANRLVDYYIQRLINEPTLHDKIEFDIVFSCYTLDLPKRTSVLLDYGFSQKDIDDITNALRELTNKIMHQEQGLWTVDAEKLITLKERREKNLAANMAPIERMYWLLEDCKRYGTLPFAGLARAGFIAVQMLKSLVTMQVLTKDDYDNFMNGLHTVSGQFTQDLANMDRVIFLEKYGHLRPGTYDILSKRYDEAPDEYLQNSMPLLSHQKTHPFTLSLEQMKNIAALLKAHGLSADIVSLFDFLKAGIELREYAKFEFTKNLSLLISIFREWGSQFGFSEDDLSFANIQIIKELYTGTDNPQYLLQRSIEDGKKRFEQTCQLWLPPLITKPEDVFAFHISPLEPNFITQKQVLAKVISSTEDKTLLKDAIVCIPSADPGFDWIFSYQIAGLITAYGGVNSHMAIRANELGLPSVIGAGELLFNRWSTAKRLHIDCANKKVDIIT